MSSDARVLMVSPPWRMPDESDLGIATLKAILAEANIPADTLSGTLLFPYDKAAEDDTFIESIRRSYSALYFAPYLYPALSVDASVDMILDTYLSDSNYGPLNLAGDAARADLEFLRARVVEDIARAGACVDACVAWVTARDYDVIGFSCTFEVQLTAGLVIAKRVKALRPDVRIVLGGASCAGEPGGALARSFPWVDAVCYSEGDRVIVPLIEALRGDEGGRFERAGLEAIAGLFWVGEDGELRQNPAPPLMVDLDTVPIPDYDDFMAQLAASPWSHVHPKLSFEMSRGCWWGQKHLCSFCGLNAAGLSYRCKTPERAVREVRYLEQRYPGNGRLCATDNILDMGYFKTVMPQLGAFRRDHAPDMSLFIEIKSNLSKAQVQVLAEAGTDYIQAGIESFSDGVLKLMRKGAIGLQQVQIVKWIHECGMLHDYNIIVLNPNEEAEHYQYMADLIPFIRHLAPPLPVRMILDRFSPYYMNPDQHGIRNVRPKPYYDVMYHTVEAKRGQMAYAFDFDHDVFADEAVLKAQRAVVRAILAWREAWVPNMAYYQERGDDLIIIDGRDAAPKISPIVGVAAQVYRYLDKAHTARAVERAFPSLDPSLIQCLLDSWMHKRWLCADARGKRYLAVIPARMREVRATLAPPQVEGEPAVRAERAALA